MEAVGHDQDPTILRVSVRVVTDKLRSWLFAITVMKAAYQAAKAQNAAVQLPLVRFARCHAQVSKSPVDNVVQNVHRQNYPQAFSAVH